MLIMRNKNGKYGGLFFAIVYQKLQINEMLLKAQKH